MPSPLSAEELRKIDAYWRAANYLSVGQIYLYDNPLLAEPLKLEHIKPRLLCVFRRSRSRFRSDDDRHSGVMAITIGAKRRWLVS